MVSKLENRDTRVQIVIVENGRFILLKHLAIKENKTFWGLPGGGREAGETDEAAAIREAKEETGLDVELLPIKIEKKLAQKRILYDRIVTFLAYPTAGEAITGCEPEADEHASYNYRLLDIKWQNFTDDSGLEPFTLEALVPIREAYSKLDKVPKAGALVYRQTDGKRRYLFVSARKNPDCLVLPQGHVDPGESAEEAAIRETREEAGYLIAIERRLGFDLYKKKNRIDHTEIFLSRSLKAVTADEDRNIFWLDPVQALSANIPYQTKNLIKTVIGI